MTKIYYMIMIMVFLICIVSIKRVSELMEYIDCVELDKMEEFDFIIELGYIFSRIIKYINNISMNFYILVIAIKRVTPLGIKVIDKAELLFIIFLIIAINIIVRYINKKFHDMVGRRVIEDTNYMRGIYTKEYLLNIIPVATVTLTILSFILAASY